MNIEKAIEIKQRIGDEFFATNPGVIVEAERLSIEALKRVKDIRRSKPVYGMDGDPVLYSLLPGETEK